VRTAVSHYPDREEHKETVQALLALGTDVAKRGAQNRTPLYHAILMSLTEVMKLLLANGADINAVSRYGMTPLHCAVTHGEVEVAHLLLENGADTTLRDLNGHTPAMLAREGDHEYLVCLLEVVEKVKILIAERKY